MIRCSDDVPWQERAYRIAKQVHLVHVEYSAFSLIMEGIEFRRSAIGYAAVAAGDLFKLGFLQGAIAHHFRSIQLIPVSVWKGQCPKGIVKKRLAIIYGKMFREHEADAIGLGTAVLRGRMI